MSETKSGHAPERSSHEVYQEFHAKYGREKETGEGYHSIRCARTVVFNSPDGEDRSMQLSVFEANASRGRYTRVWDSIGRPMTQLVYDPTGFLIVTTDGKSIQQWQATRVYGMHPRIDAVVQQYVPVLEDLCFDIVAESGEEARLNLSRNGMAGSLDFGGSQFGWILTAEQSLSDTETALRAPVRRLPIPAEVLPPLETETAA